LEIDDTGVAMSEQQLARLMGSEILVASRQGKGNLFWFDLDVGIPAAAPAEPSPADIALERLASI
jgi:hypothetical protein